MPDKSDEPYFNRIPKEPVPPQPIPDDGAEEPEAEHEDNPEDEAEETETGDDPEIGDETEIVVKTGLRKPKPPAFVIPPTEEERDARLEVIKAKLGDFFTRYKKNASYTFRYAKAMGFLLFETKAIVGHGRFMPWVHDNCQFSHSTAQNYMDVAASELKFARVGNLVEQASVDAINAHVAKKRNSKWARKFAKDEADEKAERAERSPPETLSQAYVLAKPKAKSIKEGATLITAAIQKRIKQDERSSHYVDDLELPDLTKVWPHPHLDGQCLEVEWEHPGDIIIGIYAWLPEYAHAQAESVIAGATHGHWSGGAALRYHWYIYKHFNEMRGPYRLDVDDDSEHDPDEGAERREKRLKAGDTGKTNEQVQDKLLELSEGAIRVRKLNLLDVDPARQEILERQRRFENSRRQRGVSVLDPAPLE